MGIVHLEILEPQHQAHVVGTGNVRLRGRVVSGDHGLLFFKWYSSLYAPSDPAKVALNEPTNNPLDFVISLAIGSHILTFTAKDVEGDTLDDLRRVQDAGMAGGPLDAENPCIIHVFRANMVHPAVTGPIPTLSKANSILKAEAPIKWGRRINETNNYEPDPDYHAVNRIQYRWRFEPLGLPAGRHSADLIPTEEELTFIPASNLRVVRYTGALPNVLDTGNYTLTLKVEDIENNTVGDEVSRSVKIGG